MFQTYMAPIVAQTALGMFLRTSLLLQTFLQGTIAEIRPLYGHVPAAPWNFVLARVPAVLVDVDILR